MVYGDVRSTRYWISSLARFWFAIELLVCFIATELLKNAKQADLPAQSIRSVAFAAIYHSHLFASYIFCVWGHKTLTCERSSLCSESNYLHKQFGRR